MLGYGCGCVVGWAESKGWAESWVLRAVRVPGEHTQTIRTNFGYRGLQPVVGFGFDGFRLYGYGFGDRVSGFMPSPSCADRVLVTSGECSCE
jgi:hypothetical protein